MKRASLTIGVVVAVLWAGYARAAEPMNPDVHRQDARAIIDAMLKQSRLLEDVHFRIPRSLWQQYVLAQAADRAPKPPAACIRPMGTYRLSVSGDGQVALVAELHLHVFDARSARNLPVLPANLAWSDVRLAVPDNKPATARLATVNRWLRYTPAAGGRHVISARVQLNRLSGRSGTLKLSVPVTVRTQVVFHSPRVFHVTTNSAAMTLTGKEGAGTHGTLSLEPTSRLEIRYGPPVVRRERAARYQINGHVAWNLGAANQQVAAALRVAIVDGRTDRLELSLPAGADRVSITGPDVREAQPRAGGATVFLRGTITGRTRLKVSYEVASPAGSMRRLARPDIGSGNWTGGTLVVTNTAGGSELMPAAMTGLKEMALADIPSLASAILTGKAVLAYGITSRGWSASLETIDLGEFALRETIADTAHFTFAYRAHGVVMCAADYEIRNRNRQFLRVSLPRGAKVLLARVSERSRPLTPLGGPGPRGRPDTYLLPLERSTASVKGLVSFPLQVVYMYQSQPLDREGAGGVVLPRIDMPIAYAWCEGYLPQGAGKLEFAGALQPVEEYSSKTAVATLGYGQAVALKPPKPEPRAKLVPGTPVRESKLKRPDEKPMPDKTTFGRNYWRAGQEFYKQKKYDEAQKALKKVIELLPESNEAANAIRLSSNIDLLRGKLQLRGRAEKAAAAKVQQDIATANVGQLQVQQELVEQGFAAFRKGDKEAAEARFKAAEALGKELLSQGASATEQSARLRDVREQLRRSRETARGEAGRQLEQLKVLRKAGRLKEARQVAQKLATVTDSLDTGDTDGDEEGEAGKQPEVRKELEKLREVREELRAVKIATLKQAAQRERKRRFQTALTNVTNERDQLARLVKHRTEQIKRLLAEDRELAARSGKPTTQAATPLLVDSLGEVKATGPADAGTVVIGAVVTPGGLGRKPARLEDQLTHATGERDRIDLFAKRQKEFIGELQARRKKLTDKLDKPSGETFALETHGALIPGAVARPQGQGQPKGTSGPVPRKPRMVRRVYDVRDLVADVPRGGKDRDKAGGAARDDEDRKRNIRKLSGQLEKLLAEAGEKKASITLFNGQAVVVAREGGQRIAHGLFWGLRDARGHQVQKGKSIALQEAGGTLKTGTFRDDYGAGVRFVDRSGSMVDATVKADGRKAQPKLSDDFKKFIATNYGWQKRPDPSSMKMWIRATREGDMPATRPVAGGFVHAYDEKELAARLRHNWEQKVNVSSINVNAGADTAGGLGIHFTTGNNGVRYTVVDEAQFRTLMEVDARRRNGGVDANERYQGTIVGTDALLANGWVGNVLQSSDADNTFDINGNSIRLSHEKYILIDNGEFLTAVRAGEMQHWTQEAEPVVFVRAPQTIDIPRVGELVKLEKTLVKPEDELVIRFNYQWKGAGK